jgi:C-1 hydroxylase
MGVGSAEFLGLEENKAAVRRGIEAFNGRDFSGLDEFVAADVVDHYHDLRGLEQYRQFVSMLLRVFPDFHETVEDIIAEGDRVWFRFSATATHLGEFRGRLPGSGMRVRVAPTGNKIRGEGVIIYRLEDGKIAEIWEISDMLSMYEGLGIIEYKKPPEDTK